MPKAKYLEYYHQMMEQNKDLFEVFKKVHDEYLSDPDSIDERFHEAGRKVVDVIRDWERRLCAGMGRGQYAQYSAQLSDKFWDRIRQDLPLVDRVGIRVRKI